MKKLEEEYRLTREMLAAILPGSILIYDGSIPL
jgi:hypothetical protein